MTAKDRIGYGDRAGRARRLVILAALVGGIAAATTVTALTLAASGSNRQTARTEAKRLLSVLRLPAGAQRSADEPAGAGFELSYPPSVPSAPNLVDLHEFFVVPGTPRSVIGWVESHRPAGSKEGDSGASPRERWTSFEFGGIRGVLALRELVVNAVQLRPGAVAVRVDSQTAPLPKLPGPGRGPGAVRVVESGTMLGSFGFELRCDPPGGTVPRPARICAAILANPALLYSFPGPGHSCPAGVPAVSINGRWNHKPLHSSFSECTGGQEQQAGDWATLLPSQSVEGTVHTDRAIGLVRLGENEGAVIDLLRGDHDAPAPCQSCTRIFSAGYYTSSGTGPGQPAGWTVSFSHARVSRIENNVPALTIEGAYAARGFTSLRRSLHGWRTRACGHTHELVHSSATGTTIIVYGTDFERLIVTAAPGVCPVQRS